MNSTRPLAQLRKICQQAVYWDWRLDDPDLPLREWRFFLRWHAIAEHRDMLDAIAEVREQIHHRSAQPSPAAAGRGLLIVRTALFIVLLALLGSGTTAPRTHAPPAAAYVTSPARDDLRPTPADADPPAAPEPSAVERATDSPSPR